MGSIPELGLWSEFKCPMNWTEGHVWVAENIQIKEPIFQYKYVLK